METVLLTAGLHDPKHSMSWNGSAIPSYWHDVANVMRKKPLLLLSHILSPGIWSQWFGLLVGLLLVACLTYVSSTLDCWMAMRQDNTKRSLKTPTVPYWIPGLFHSISLFDPPTFLQKLIKRFGTDKPLEVRAAWLRFTIFADPEHIKTVFRKSKQVANKSTTLFALHYLFGLPKDVVRFFRADDSGLRITPRKGSTVPAESRINFLIAHTLAKMLKGHHLEALSKRYLSLLLRNLDALDVASEDGQWTDFPDLYAFLQHIAIGSSVEAIAGSKLQELHPTFVKDISTFHSYVPKFLHLLPRWLIPDAFRVRGRLLANIKAWHAYAHQHSDCNRIGAEDPEWEPYFGTKLVRRRQQYALKMKEMTADARATEDLGLLFGSAANVAPAIFWFIFEALKDNVLQSRLMAEVSVSLCPPSPPSFSFTESEGKGHRDTAFDITALVAQPLLQSVYAETLRLYVAAAISRVAEHDDVNIAGYTVPKGDFLVMYSHLLALDADAWTRAGRVLTKPLDEFDAERFLVAPGWTRPLGTRAAAPERKDPKPATTAAKEEKKKENDGSNHVPLSDDGRRFSMDGLLGLWIPYGGGDHICPGRYFAKQEIILTFAALFTKFDIELAFTSPGAAASVRPDMRHAPFGTLPPLGTVPFRMRRKTG